MAITNKIRHVQRRISGTFPLLGIFKLVIITRSESKWGGNQQGRNTLSERVQMAHDRIVIPPSVLDVVLDIHERVMQVQIILAGL